MTENSKLFKILASFVDGSFRRKVWTHFDKWVARRSRRVLSLITKIHPRKIMFMTYQNNYTCNPKYIAEELLKHNHDYDLVLAVGKKNYKAVRLTCPEQIRLVKRNTFQFFYEVATSKVWIDNSINFVWEPMPKKKSQIYIETWHGSMGLKRVGKNDVNNPYWVKRAKVCAKYTDYCISNSDFETGVYHENHWPNSEILLYGHPRNDILFCNDDKIKQKIRDKVCEELEIDSDCKLLLYAPTFRDSGDISCYDINYPVILKAFEKRFGGKWVVLTRHHFHDRISAVARESIEKYKNVYNATKYGDMQELLLVADAGITDYSSWICDYVLTRKPAFIFATDIEDYNTERGLYYPLESTPFPIATNNKELEENVLNFDDTKYKNEIEDYLKDKGCVEDGHASERVAKKIAHLIGE